MTAWWNKMYSLLSWEKATTGFFDTVHLGSIKSKIITFALLATLIPSVSMGWLSYRNNRRALDDKHAHELNKLTSRAARELDLWVEERHEHTKVLSSSYEITENLAKLSDPDLSEANRSGTRRHIQGYLEKLQRRLTEYEELVVLDAEGSIVASSKGARSDLHLPDGWLDRARGDNVVIGEPYWDPDLDAQVMAIGESIRTQDDIFMGTFLTRVRFDEVHEILAGITEGPDQELYAITKHGRVLASAAQLGTTRRELGVDTVGDLFAFETVPISFTDFNGVEVVGAVQSIPDLGWGVVAQKDRAQTYQAVAELRNFTLGLIVAVALGIGVAAYLFCLGIVRPLSRMSGGATAVASGNLEVKLPVYGRSEISHMTAAFNEMVERLREFRTENAEINKQLLEHNEKLQELSIRDGLTGLYNRNHMPDMLSKQLARAKRYGHAFSVLMVDIDHFKKYNDTNGHQAGDDALVDVSTILEDSVRECDYVTRYGGEEFLILLTATKRSGAKHFAERIRERIEQMHAVGKAKVTISLGVASFPENGDTIESIIGDADAALYKCKHEGRNRVEVAKSRGKKKRKLRASG